MKDYDPSEWGYEAPDNLCNWRLYEKHSQGLFTELASHMIAITNWLGVEGKDPEEVKAHARQRHRCGCGCAPFGYGQRAGIYKFKDGEEGIYESKPTQVQTRNRRSYLRHLRISQRFNSDLLFDSDEFL